MNIFLAHVKSFTLPSWRAKNSVRRKVALGCSGSYETSSLVPRWLTSTNPIQFLQHASGRNDASSVVCVCPVRHRPHYLFLSSSTSSLALLDDEYPIVVNVTNIDEPHLDISVDILLQPTEVDEVFFF